MDGRHELRIPCKIKRTTTALQGSRTCALAACTAWCTLPVGSEHQVTRVHASADSHRKFTIKFTRSQKSQKVGAKSGHLHIPSWNAVMRLSCCCQHTLSQKMEVPATETPTLSQKKEVPATETPMNLLLLGSTRTLSCVSLVLALAQGSSEKVR